MLYFSSSHLKNQTFLSLEQLLKEVTPESTLLVLDTNIVIFLRDFYLNPKHFLEAHNSSGAGMAVKYLIEQISRYNLEVNATMGVDESSRSKVDFSKIESKWQQTHNSVQNILSLDLADIDAFVKNKSAEDPIKSEGDYPATMIPFLKQETFYQHHLIISYLLCLKIILLQTKLVKGEIQRKDAFLQLCSFMRKEVDCVSAIIQLFAQHLFGGLDDYKKIIFPKYNLPLNERMHQIFNGAIDLLFPTVVDKTSEFFYPKEIARNFVPVFVSTDKRISNLHSLINIRIIIDNGEQINYNPNIVQTNFKSGMIWTNDDYNDFNEIGRQDSLTRYFINLNMPRKATHLLGLVGEHESLVKEALIT